MNYKLYLALNQEAKPYESIWFPNQIARLVFLASPIIFKLTLIMEPLCQILPPYLALTIQALLIYPFHPILFIVSISQPLISFLNLLILFLLELITFQIEFCFSLALLHSILPPFFSSPSISIIILLPSFELPLVTFSFLLTKWLVILPQSPDLLYARQSILWLNPLPCFLS